MVVKEVYEEICAHRRVLFRVAACLTFKASPGAQPFLCISNSFEDHDSLRNRDKQQLGNGLIPLPLPMLRKGGTLSSVTSCRLPLNKTVSGLGLAAYPDLSLVTVNRGEWL